MIKKIEDKKLKDAPNQSAVQGIVMQDGRPLEFPPLMCGGDARPVTWSYQLDTVEGEHIPTNSVTIFSRPCLSIDESGENGSEEFNIVTLTRAEIAGLLRVLEDDIEKMRFYCPDSEFA